MTKFIVLAIKSSTEQSFPFVLQVRGEQPNIETHFSGSLTQLYEIKESWGNQFSHLCSASVRKLISIDQMKCESQQVNSQFQHCQNWFTTRENELEEIRKIILKELHTQEEIHLLIQTSDLWIKRLPWYEWDILRKYSHIEFSILLVSSEPANPSPQIASKIVSKDAMRILAVFGNSMGIDITPDEAAIRALPNVETSFLNQPNAQDLSDQLRNEQGWDILFFAGHSSSSIDGKTGEIDLNQEYSLTIPDLKKALKKAIEQGLQLAIFNSCDGLGLANQLADLDIPQVIVMRESVPDRAAQIFIQVFLKAFSSGLSVHRSVRLAREKLQEYGTLKSGGQVSGLPTICQIAIQTEVVWRQNPRVRFIPPIKEKPPWRVITEIQAHDASINAIALTSQKIVSTSNISNSIKVWQFPSGEFDHSLTGQTRTIRAISVHSQGAKVAIALNRTIKIWNVNTEQLEQVGLNYKGKLYTPSAILFSPDGEMLATGDQVGGKIKIWDIATGRLLQTLSAHFWGTWSLITTHSYLISSTVGYPIKLWNWHTGKLIGTLNDVSGVLKPIRNWLRRDSPQCVALSPDQKLIAVGDSNDCIKLWCLNTRTVQRQLGSHIEVQAIVFSPDGEILATSGSDRIVRLWHVQTGQVEATLIHSKVVTCLAFSADSQSLVTGSGNGRITIWHKQSS